MGLFSGQSMGKGFRLTDNPESLHCLLLFYTILVSTREGRLQVISACMERGSALYLLPLPHNSCFPSPTSGKERLRSFAPMPRWCWLAVNWT